MSITSVKSGATGISLALDNNYMEPIATTLVGSGGTSTIFFNDIPQTYKHLHLRITSYNSGGNVTVQHRFNGDASPLYTRHAVSGDGSTTSALGQADMGIGSSLVFSSNTANIFYASILDILDYSDTNKFKTIRSLNGVDYNGSGGIALSSSLYRSTNPITTINLYAAGGLIAQYSRFSLYGIKG
jgi:hypothetical protein